MTPVQFSLYQKVDLVHFSLRQKWIRSSFCSAKSGPGPVFARPKMDPVQFLLGQKWTRSSFHFAKGGPGPVFAQPKVDPSKFSFSQKWTRFEWSFVEQKCIGSTYRSLFSVVHNFTTADKPLAAIYLSLLFEHYHPRYMPLSVYSGTSHNGPSHKRTTSL